MFLYSVLVTVICQAGLMHLGHSYRILCVFPTESISHQVVFRGLTLALNKRGHELIVVTTNPIKDPTLVNYTEININYGYEPLNRVNWIENRKNEKTVSDFVLETENSIIQLLDRILQHPNLRKLYAPESKEVFDLLIVETLLWEGVYPLATRFDVPFIGITSLAPSLNTLYAIGSPVMTSQVTNWELATRKRDKQTSFWQRMKDFVATWKYLYWYRTTFLAKQEAVARKYFGNNIPNLNNIASNMSLIFVNQQAPISYVTPHVPKVMRIGGFHLSEQTIELPSVLPFPTQDLKKTLDEARKGFIYMSLGSNAKSTMMSNKTKEEFIKAFSKLSFKVLWKFEDDVFPRKPVNVHIMKWVPQKAVLAHPNLKVFIYQGGVQSTEEAVHYAVPLIGLPVLCDQDMQVDRMVANGVAKKLEITAIDSDELLQTINTVANDPRYKQKMLELRSFINDKPHDLLDNAVWWTEYVIRHRGAPHLHSTTADDPWYRRQDIDIVAFICTGSVILLGSTLVILNWTVKRICSYNRFTAPLVDKKIN